MHIFINIFGLHIPSYGLCFTSALLLCGFLIIRSAKKRGICFEDMIIIITATMSVAIMGAKLLYILVTYTPAQMLGYIKNLDFTFIIDGGIVFYGGLIGGMLGAVVACKLLKVPLTDFERCAVPYVPLGHAIGRIGCLLAGCCHGFEYYGPLAVKSEFLADGKMYFPIQAVEAIMNVVIMVILLLYRRKTDKKDTSDHGILILYLLLYSIMRFTNEFFRGDSIRGVNILSTSQWISVALFIACIAAIVFRKKKN